MATPDEVKLQKGSIAPTQKEQTGSAKAVSLIESLAAGKPSLPTGTTISPQLQVYLQRFLQQQQHLL
jgi:hypothetical protein